MFYAGSHPPLDNGEHLKIRTLILKMALKKLYLFKASKAYCEQDG